jgi:hypothetical protein
MIWGGVAKRQAESKEDVLCGGSVFFLTAKVRHNFDCVR